MPPTACTGCRFGASVAASRDNQRIVVGAPGESSGAGAAYVFVHSGATWMQEARLVATTPHANAWFGASLALGENGGAVAIGAPGETSGAGAVIVFARAGSTWNQTQRLGATAPHGGDALGKAVAMSGLSIAAGAPDASAGAGATIVFASNGTSYTQQQLLVAPNAHAGAHFGAAVGLVGDLLVVGAPDEASADTVVTSNSCLPGAGAAYHFTRAATTWSFTEYLKAQAPATLAQFGAAVAIGAAGDTLVIGAPGDAGLASGGGALFAYTGGPAYSASPPRRILEPQANQHVGASVVIAGTLVVTGAPGDTANAGAAYAF